MKLGDSQIKLLVTDIDNTVFDWVEYYVTALSKTLIFVAEKIGSDYDTLAAECKVIFSRHTIEYPFVVQELPSVIKYYNNDIDKILWDCVNPARQYFKDIAAPLLTPFPGVHDTMVRLKSEFPDVQLIALTDAPRYVAMWKLNKLGLLKDFDAVYGLADPILPTDPELNKVKVSADILLKHLQHYNFGFAGKVRILPDEYEKPGTRGFRTIFMDYNLENDKDHGKILWVGDNLLKDVLLGRRMGVKTAWAKYGAEISDANKKLIESFGPPQSIRQSEINIDDAEQEIKPDIILQSFGEILDYLR